MTCFRPDPNIWTLSTILKDSQEPDKRKAKLLLFPLYSKFWSASLAEQFESVVGSFCTCNHLRFSVTQIDTGIVNRFDILYPQQSALFPSARIFMETMSCLLLACNLPMEIIRCRWKMGTGACSHCR
jgi:hypothetical protein